ncbi:DUF7519 family protein [Halosolutus gelatinilyticus]|uniref:DUF7519 family protein n=1 Tax=Halosolutus gelatinilyticus TaxID=2931975 RepID=UPI001FF5F52B|nr:hypothetical protein [Halosolutus gelatinilyticus]
MTRTDRSPARLSGVASCVAAGCAAIASGLYSWYALAAGGVGLALLVSGVARGTRSSVSLGAAALVAGAIVAGVQGAAAGAVLVSVVAAVLAWDAGTTAISIGEQLGRKAPTRRIELVHLAASAAVGALTIGAGYLLYEIATDGQPLSALVLLIVATVLLLTAILRDDAASRG